MLAARMPVDLTAGHHLVGDPAEPAAHLHVRIPRVLAGGTPPGCQPAEVIITTHQIISDNQDRLAERPVPPRTSGPSLRSTRSL